MQAPTMPFCSDPRILLARKRDMHNARDARQLGGRFSSAGDIASRDQHIDGPAQVQRGGERPRGYVGQVTIRDFGKKEGRHVRSLPLRL